MIKKIIPLLFILLGFTYPQNEVEQFRKGMEAFNAERYAEALNYFDYSTQNHRLSDELYSTAKYYSGEALLNLGKLDAATQDFEYVIRNFESSSFRDKALYRAGIIYFDQVKYEESRKKLKQLLEEYPESEFSGASLYWIGESYTRENNLEAAVNFLVDAIENKKNNNFLDYTLYSLASVYEKMEDYESAVRYYDQLLSYHKDTPLKVSARIRIGICYFKLKDYQSSILELNNPQINDLSPDLYSESLTLLANSYYRVEEYASAEKTYKEIIQQYPGYGNLREVKYGLAWTYFQQKKYSESFKAFGGLADGYDSIAVKSLYWKGESKRYGGQEQDALKVYREFLQKYPDNPLALTVQYQMGIIYYNGRKFDLAEKFLSSALNSKDKNVLARSFTMLGELNLEQKHYLQALKFFNESMDVTGIPADLQNRSLLGAGIASFCQEKFKDALASLGELELRDPSFERDKVKFYLAETYFKLANYDQALSHYNQVSSDNARLAPYTLYGRAYTYFNTQQYELAADAFSDFIKKYSKDSRVQDARFRLADCYYGNKNYKAAGNVYKEIFKGNLSSPHDPYAYYQYAQSLYKGGNPADAVNEFKNLQMKFPQSEYADKSLYLVGWILFRQDRYDEAINGYNDVLNVYPNSALRPVIYYSIGDAFYNKADYESAISSYQKVLDEFPSSNSVFDAVNGIQYCYLAQGKPDKAIILINDFIAKNPNSSFADQLLFKKGEIYYNTKAYEKAKTAYREFINAYPKNSLVPEAYYWISKSAQMEGQLDEAIQNFTVVFEQYPSNETAAASVIEAATIYNKQKKYDAALGILNKASMKLLNSPRLPEIIFLKASTNANSGNISRAYEVYSGLLQNYPGNIFTEKAKLEMGLIDLAAGRSDQADIFFKNLSETRSDELGAKGQFYYGVSLAEQQKLKDAVSALVRVKTVYGNFDEWVTRSNLKLGDIYIQLNDINKAREMFKSVIAKHSGDIYGQEAQSKLRGLK